VTGGALPHSVPLRLRDLDALVGRDWDIAVRRIVPFIDGVAHVRGIASAADVALPIALATIDSLVSHGLVSLMDVFSPWAVYRLGTHEEVALQDPAVHAGVVVTGAAALPEVAASGVSGSGLVRARAPSGPRLSLLVSDLRLQNALLRLIAPDVLGRETLGKEAIAEPASSRGEAAQTTAAKPQEQPPQADRVSASSLRRAFGEALPRLQPARSRAMVLRDATRLVSLFGRGRAVSSVLGSGTGSRLLQRLGCGSRAVVTFCVTHGILRRCHEYPTPCSGLTSERRAADSSRDTGQEGGAMGVTAEETAAPGKVPGAARESDEGVSRLSEQDTAWLHKARPLLDGKSTMDAVCCAMRCTRSRLLRCLESPPPGWPTFVVVYC
jgi:hypothetical protein